MDLNKIGDAISAALSLLEGELPIIESQELRDEYELVINLLKTALREVDSGKN